MKGRKGSAKETENLIFFLFLFLGPLGRILLVELLLR